MTNAQAILAANGVMAGIAVAANLWAVFRSDHPRQSAMVAALATFFIASYVWLGFHGDAIVEWSEFMRGVSLIAWPVVWIYPALRARDATVKAAKVAEGLLAKLPDGGRQ